MLRDAYERARYLPLCAGLRSVMPVSPAAQIGSFCETLGYQWPDGLAGEEIGLAAPCVRQADRDVDRDDGQRPPSEASSTSSPIPVAACALSIPSDRAIPIHPDLHASTPSTRQPLTATSLPGPSYQASSSFLGDARASSPKEPTSPAPKIVAGSDCSARLRTRWIRLMHDR